jgi:hypothetical protein
MSELEWTAPAKTRRVVKAEIIRITHAMCAYQVNKRKKEKEACARGANARDRSGNTSTTHLVTTPVIHRLRPNKSGVIHSALLMRLKKRR